MLDGRVYELKTLPTELLRPVRTQYQVYLSVNLYAQKIGLIKGRTESLSPISHPAISRCNKNASIAGCDIGDKLSVSPFFSQCFWHILLWKLFSLADSRRASWQLLPKGWALNTGKLPLGGLFRNSVVK